MKKILPTATLLLFSALAFSAEIAILEKELLNTKRIVLNTGEKCTLQGKMMKSSVNLKKDEKLGLRLRAICQHPTGTGWNYFMQLKVHGKLITRFTEHGVPRLINRAETKSPEGASFKKWYGEPWFNPYKKAWDVVYRKNFPETAVELDKSFCEDVTWYLFDVDDLVTIDRQFSVELCNIGDQMPGIVSLMKNGKQKFPLVIDHVEIVKFKEPEGRLPASIKLPVPSDAQINALAERLGNQEFFSEKYLRCELENLRYAESAFAKNEHQWIVPYTIPGHLWIQYDNTKLNAEKYIPLLDMAKKSGIGLVKIHAYWADIHNTTPFAPAGKKGDADFRKLIRLCHDRNLKLTVYVSPSWVKLNKVHRKEWEYSMPDTGPKAQKWGHVCTCDPSWRSVFFNSVQKIFETYDVDGIYVDLGIYQDLEKACSKAGHINAFKNSQEKNAYVNDMMMRLYALCKAHRKLLYLFFEPIPEGAEKYCDFLITGESTPSMPSHKIRNGHLTGNIFFLPMTHAFTYYSPREIYAYTMALGHFPVINYFGKKQNDELKFFRYFLVMENQLVKPGTHIYRNIRNAPLIKNASKNIYATAYVNSSCYLVLANHGNKPEKVSFSAVMENVETGKMIRETEIPARDLVILRKL